MKKVVILGAGMTGLFAAYKLSKKFQVILIEKSKDLGGMSYSFKHKNFLLDYGPHKIYTELPGIMPEIDNLIGLQRIKKKNSIYLQGTYFNFPLQLVQLLTRMPGKGIQSGMDILLKPINKMPDTSYENFLINNFGNTLYSLVFKTYAKKIWGNPIELDVDLAKKRVAVSGIFQLIKSVILKDTGKISAEYFYYPETSISQLSDVLAEQIIKNKGKILLNEKIKEIKNKKGKFEIILKNKKLEADILISTIPLIDLSSYLGNKEMIDNASKLKYKDTNIFYFIINRSRVLKENWIFFPSLEIPFHRISEQKSFSQACCPENKTTLLVESTLSEKYKKDIKDKLIQLRIIKEEEIEEVFVKTLYKAYPVYLKGYKSYLDNILAYLDKINNFYTIGRHGLFNYNNMDQCIDMAKKLVEHIIDNKDKENWLATRKSFDKYRIVD